MSAPITDDTVTQYATAVAPIQPLVGMGVQGGGGKVFGFIPSLRVNAPVHEQMTIAALLHSDFQIDPAIKSFIDLRDNPAAHHDLNDFVRGVIWNDDPRCLLFDETATSENLVHSTGTVWLAKFAEGKASAAVHLIDNISKAELIQRSHFGDLQWLHAMACRKGEDFNETKRKIMTWMEVMYKLAIGVTSPDEAIDNSLLKGIFDDPTTYKTLGKLLTQNHSAPANIQHRALGSCFHVIQDSYAVGHTRRKPLNLQDRVPGEGMKYQPGVADRWGSMLNFHTYVGQSSDHAKLDHSDDKTSIEKLDLKSVDIWNGIVGCRDGVDACIKIANFWVRKAAWEEVRAWLDDVVFKISANASPADNTVD